jgi:hypothetical protein
LLFSFQRPSLTPRTEPTALEPSLEHRGVAKTTVLLQGGRRIYQRRPASSRGKLETEFRTTSVTEGTDFYIGPPHPSSLAATSSSPLRPGGAASNPPRAPPSSPREPSTSCPLRPFRRQGAFSTRVPPRRQVIPRRFSFLRPGELVGEGASCTRHPGSCQARNLGGDLNSGGRRQPRRELQ